MQTHVGLEYREDVAYLTLACDEPGKPATLDMAVLDELDQRLAEIEARAGELVAVVVQSAAARYFVVGANVNALQTLDAETVMPWVQKGHAVFNRLEALPLPVIARVEGYALGGGLELAMACDMILASRTARLGQPEANLGFVAGWGGSYRLPRRVGVARAKELLFTGRAIDAEEAYHMGLVNWAVDEGDLDGQLETLLGDMRKLSRVAIAQMKKLVHDSPYLTAEQSCAHEAVASAICLSSGDTQARVAAFLESRKKRKE
jgi:enoyl-CoA hydratase